MKSVRIWSYSGQYFPAFGQNTERYSVSLRIQSECGKIWTIITPNTDTFYAMLSTLVSHIFWVIPSQIIKFKKLFWEIKSFVWDTRHICHKTFQQNILQNKIPEMNLTCHCIGNGIDEWMFQRINTIFLRTKFVFVFENVLYFLRTLFIKISLAPPMNWVRLHDKQLEFFGVFHGPENYKKFQIFLLQ